MAKNKDIYILGQSQTGAIDNIGEEIRIDLNLEDNILNNVGTVFGEVLDVNGDGLEGVTIKVTDTDYNPKYHVITDADGKYTIDNVEAGEQYLILAVKNQYDLKQGTSFMMQVSQQIERDFVMTQDVNADKILVAGDIIDSDGAKLEGVTVRLFDNYTGEPVLEKETHTNQFGQYAFFDIPQGMYLIQSTFLGYKTIETNFVVLGNEQVININLTMQDDPISRKGTINGVIKDKNEIPVVGAFVILFEVTTDGEGKEVLRAIRRTLTNDEGLYLFEQVPEGNYKIKANKTEV